MRCVVHVDLDAFYAQVETIRTATSPTLPLAVQQWSSVIAVNYPARHTGITRHLTVAECMAKCPQLLLVHVATMSIDDVGEETGGEVKVVKSYEASNGAHRVDSRRCKASLEPYRRASRAIFKCIHDFFTSTDLCENVVVEKASVDEAFIAINVNINDDDFIDFIGVPIMNVNDDEPIDQDNSTMEDRVIAKGTVIAAALRAHLFNTLGYTMSAGIAKNKTLAKLASARNKPANQTYVLERHIEPLMRVTPFSKIRFLGGKLGRLLRGEGDRDDGDDLSDNEMAVSSEPDPSAFELQQRTVDELAVRTGDRQSALWIYNVIRGQDDSPVIDRSHVKSFMAAKQHRPPLEDGRVLLQWMRLFCAELTMRVMAEFEETRRWPHTVTLHYRHVQQTARSKTIPLLINHHQINKLFSFTQKHLLTSLDGPLKLNLVGLSVSKFTTVSVWAGKAMDSFLRPGTADPFQFTKPPSHNNNTVWKCDKCSQWYEVRQADKIQQHQDYHVAMDLAKQMY